MSFHWDTYWGEHGGEVRIDVQIILSRESYRHQGTHWMHPWNVQKKIEIVTVATSDMWTKTFWEQEVFCLEAEDGGYMVIVI